jgi:lactaldehyde reductase
MAHTLGAVYDTPHGVACAMMLPIVMEYNADCTGEKYREIARAMGVKGVDDMSVEEYRKAAVDAVQKLSIDVGIPTKLEALKEEDLDFLAESAHADACAPGNPKDASVEDLKALFRGRCRGCKKYCCKVNRSLGDVVSQILWCFYRL